MVLEMLRETWAKERLPIGHKKIPIRQNRVLPAWNLFYETRNDGTGCDLLFHRRLLSHQLAFVVQLSFAHMRTVTQVQFPGAAVG
jgi:hypothetical protein